MSLCRYVCPAFPLGVTFPAVPPFSSAKHCAVGGGSERLGTAVPGHGLYCVLALLCARLFALHRAALVGGTGSGPGPGFRLREGRPRGTFRARGLSGGCVLRLFVLFCDTVALFCFVVGMV